MRRMIVGVVGLLAVCGTAAPVGAEEAAPDLGVTIAWGSGGTPHVRSGDVATWTLTVTNLGDASASGVEVLASGSDQFGQFTSSCGLGDYCPVGDLQPGESRTVTFSATACLIQAGSAPARRTWWVDGAAWTAGDPNPADNTARLDVRITGSPNTACPGT